MELITEKTVEKSKHMLDAEKNFRLGWIFTFMILNIKLDVQCNCLLRLKYVNVL